jgi:hypothetical protein
MMHHRTFPSAACVDVICNRTSKLPTSKLHQQRRYEKKSELTLQLLLLDQLRAGLELYVVDCGFLCFFLVEGWVIVWWPELGFDCDSFLVLGLVTACFAWDCDYRVDVWGLAISDHEPDFCCDYGCAYFALDCASDYDDGLAWDCDCFDPCDAWDLVTVDFALDFCFCSNAWGWAIAFCPCFDCDCDCDCDCDFSSS